jgi:hypothetical protein
MSGQDIDTINLQVMGSFHNMKTGMVIYMSQPRTLKPLTLNL